MTESRLFRIVYVLLERDNVTARELAEQFEEMLTDLVVRAFQSTPCKAETEAFD